MLTRSLGSALALVAALLAGACTDQATTPTTVAIDNATHSGIGNAPEFSGIIVRGQATNAWTWVDVVSGYRVVIGADMNEYCAGVINFDLVFFQDINLSNGRPLLEVVDGDDMRTTVWDFLSFDCALFTTVDPVAYGYADLVNTDNDLFGTAPGDNNANAWGLRAHGILSYQDGSDAVFSAHQNLKFSANGGFNQTSKISLH